MNSGDMFKMVNDQIMQENIMPANEETYNAFATYYSSQTTFEEFVLKLKKFEIPINNIRIVTNNLVQLWYVEEGIFIPIHGIEENMLSMMKVMDVAESRRDWLKEVRGKKSLRGYFEALNFASPEFLFFEFLRMYKQIPEDEIYDIFRFCYSSVDYGFDRLPRSLVEELLRGRKGKSFAKPAKGFKRDDRGLVIIYRGTNTQSFDATKANSWTTNLAVAAHFASRFRKMDGLIYEARIREENILDYIEERGEDEVLVIPDDLMEMEIFDIYSFDTEFMEWLQDKNITSEYVELLQKFLVPDIFNKKKGIHGALHTKRVLLLTMILAHKMGLDDLDRLVLCFTAIFHDIGRNNDGLDIHHGKKSVEKWKEYGIPKMIRKSQYSLDDKAIVLIEKLIELHPYEDWFGEAELRKIYTDEKIIKMFQIFKDADGLDRVRFAGLDPDRLRTLEAKKLILVAYQTVHNVL